MKVALSPKKPAFRQASCDVCFLTAEETKRLRQKVKNKSPLFSALNENIFTGEKYKVISLIGCSQGESMILAGLGEEKKVSPASIMHLSGLVLNEARKLRTKHILTELPVISGLKEKDIITAILDGFLLSDYQFLRKSQPDKSVKPEDMTIFGVKTRDSNIAARHMKISEAVNYARDLVNDNADRINTLGLAAEALKTAKEHKIKATIIDEKQLKKLGCNLICAVGQGAVKPPRFVILEYKNSGKNSKTIALVGKGITYDSGGLNLKPTGYLEDMKHDMAGAAAVLGALKAIASLKLRVNVIGVMAIAENAIGSRAYKPGDIFTAYNGKTVEIQNTDAEGRLVLADALSYTEDKYKPDYMIDMATLTGAVIIALGDSYAGLMTEDREFEKMILQSSEETRELVWPLPLTEPFMDEMKSDVADLKNTGEGRSAGTIRGAVFLKAFVKKSKWAHLDIAGVSWNSKKSGYKPRYASGFGVRLLVNLCSKF